MDYMDLAVQERPLNLITHSPSLCFNQTIWRGNVDGLMQDCSISFANALETLQSCTKPSMSSIDLRQIKFLSIWKQIVVMMPTLSPMTAP